MKKIFIVTGEVSGDKLAAWYLNKLKEAASDVVVEGVGGDCLSAAGVKLYERMEKLNVAGFIEIAKRLRFILSFLKKLSHYILTNNFDEVVVVDFPGFNLRLIKKLKKENPEIKVTYLCPPQLWIWGEWRIKKLKKFCDKVVVLYPFEVEWYKSRGVDAQFLGNPLSAKLKPFFTDDFVEKNAIAIIPASRSSEVDQLFPVFSDVVKRFKMIYPKTKIILPLAESFSKSFIELKLKQHGLQRWGSDIEIVQGEQEKFKALSRCYLAITKPGTVSLEVALLKVPAVIVYKTSWLTYLFAKFLVKIKYMSLPNLLLKKPVYKEFIQGDCKAKLIFNHASQLYKSARSNDEQFKKLHATLLTLHEKLQA